MLEQTSRLFFCISVMLIIALVPVLQAVPLNLPSLLPSASATSGVTINNFSTTSGSGTSTVTISNFNASAGSNRMLLVAVQANNQNATSVKFGSTNLSEAVGSFHLKYTAFWYLTNPSGTASIVVTFAGTTGYVIGAYALSGVDQANPIPTTATNSNGGNPFIPLNTEFSNSRVIDSVSSKSGSTLSNPTCAQEWNIQVANQITGASSTSQTTTPGYVNCSWTTNQSPTSWDDAGIEVKANGTSTPVTPIMLNGKSTVSNGDGKSATIYNFKPGSNSNRLLLVGVEEQGPLDPTSIKFGSASLTKAISSNTNHSTSFWYLPNPSSTPANLTVSYSSSTAYVVGAYALYGVNQTLPIPTTATNSSTSGNPTISITAKYPNSWVLDSPAIYGGATLSNPSCTQEWNLQRTGQVTGASSNKTTTSAGAVTCNWTSSRTGDKWDDVAIELNAVPNQPNGVYVNRTASTTAYISWTAPQGYTTGIGYKIERSSNGGASWNTINPNTGNSTTHYYDTGLTGGALYAYRISAVEPYGTSVPSATIASFNPISYSNPHPSLPQNVTQFFTVLPANETGFQAGEQVNTTYYYPTIVNSHKCSISLTANSNGAIVTNGPACAQGSAVYTGYGAHEGTSYNVTAVGATSGSSTTITFVPTLTNGSDWLAGSTSSAPKVYNSNLTLQYCCTHDNTFIPTGAINNHNAIGKLQKIKFFDYAESFKNATLKLYPDNVTKVIQEYNDSGAINGIQQGIISGFNVVEYDPEESNNPYSTPCQELAIQSAWNGGNGTKPCLSVSSSNINASAVGNYTNDASLRVKNANKLFEWAGELSALRVAQSYQTPAYKHINWSRVDILNLQVQNKTFSGSDNYTNFNSTISTITDYVKKQNPYTLVFVQVKADSDRKCGCTPSSILYSLQYARFHAGTPTKWEYDGVTISINRTSNSQVDTFDTWLGR